MVARRKKHHGPLEQIRRSSAVAAGVRSSSGDRETDCGTLAQRLAPRCRRPEFGKTLVRLLEVVPHDFVELATPAVKPVRDPLVQVGAALLRDPVVCSVSDQHVPEPKRVVDRLVRSDQLLPHKPEEERTRRAAAVRGKLGKRIPLELEPHN